MATAPDTRRTSVDDVVQVDPETIKVAASVVFDPLDEVARKLERLAAGKTIAIRCTVLQELRVVFRAPCPCRVHLLTPPSAYLVFDFDVEPEEYGLDRVYKVPTIPPGVATHPFTLTAGQTVIAAAESGSASFTLLVEPMPAGR